MNEQIRDKILTMMGGLIVFFTPVFIAAAWVGALVLCDYITGVKKAQRLKTFTTWSKSVRVSADKLTNYGIALIVARIMEQVIIKDSFPALQVVMFVIIAGELQSIRENIKANIGIDILKEPMKAIMRKK